MGSFETVTDSTPRHAFCCGGSLAAHHFAACSVWFRIHSLMSSVNVQPANSSREVGTGTGSGLAVASFMFAILGPVITITAGADAVRR